MIADGEVAGFKGMKRQILVALRKSQPLTVQGLAQYFGVTPNALRRHLKELETGGFLSFEREVKGVGGPSFSYRLTSAGERLFPSAYEQVLSQALESVRDRFGSEAVVDIFRERWSRIAEQARPELQALPLAERTTRLAQLLSSMGYMAEATPGDGTLREHNCTIRAVVERFPEVCAAEERFIQEVLGADVKRQSHIAKGANCCEYCITERTTATQRPDGSQDPTSFASDQLQRHWALSRAQGTTSDAQEPS